MSDSKKQDQEHVVVDNSVAVVNDSDSVLSVHLVTNTGSSVDELPVHIASIGPVAFPVSSDRPLEVVTAKDPLKVTVQNVIQVYTDLEVPSIPSTFSLGGTKRLLVFPANGLEFTVAEVRGNGWIKIQVATGEIGWVNMVAVTNYLTLWVDT